ncbi:uncharacterized protein BKA78DRAFT_92290 [Phyllosticta capitalensis]|uniref:uncharacterized protein n=1 Tax=Phyllosticta capitalensis TaxID=121624 RepID=UPI00313011C7
MEAFSLILTRQRRFSAEGSCCWRCDERRTTFDIVDTMTLLRDRLVRCDGLVGAERQTDRKSSKASSLFLFPLTYGRGFTADTHTRGEAVVALAGASLFLMRFDDTCITGNCFFSKCGALCIIDSSRLCFFGGWWLKQEFCTGTEFLSCLALPFRLVGVVVVCLMLARPLFGVFSSSSSSSSSSPPLPSPSFLRCSCFFFLLIDSLCSTEEVATLSSSCLANLSYCLLACRCCCCHDVLCPSPIGLVGEGFVG